MHHHVAHQHFPLPEKNPVWNPVTYWLCVGQSQALLMLSCNPFGFHLLVLGLFTRKDFFLILCQAWPLCVYPLSTWHHHMMMKAPSPGGGVRVRVWIRERRKIRRRPKALLSLWWRTWTSLPSPIPSVFEAINAGGDNNVGMRLQTSFLLLCKRERLVSVWLFFCPL